MQPWPIPGYGQIVEVETRHLLGWTEIAKASTDWMRWPPFQEPPHEVRSDREARQRGLTWQQLGQLHGSDFELPGMVVELVLESANHEPLLALELRERPCPAHVEAAVSISVARRPGPVSSGAALATLREVPALVKREVGHDHVVAEVCTANNRSTALMARVGWNAAGTGRCDYHHEHLVPCEEIEDVYCAWP